MILMMARIMVSMMVAVKVHMIVHQMLQVMDEGIERHFFLKTVVMKNLMWVQELCPMIAMMKARLIFYLMDQKEV